ncbi:uncharacterized protein F4822DRAFT_269140 [Hypoxylon trugodes]|uniref:uncharacterized protein n=1 Tax=Hypoxylon trugodes TaxID=326681 RepID=UPI002199DF7B|nr:uncharacterized protein F4822DRAFT_269140 [Hypoxylon trugodes]KAI1389096.1 hypothetical protein F4822DRAFT_269140 [Hypoxylon trugodes]
MSSHQSFPQFPRLPAEIRRLIWIHALPRGRIQLFAKNVPWENWRLLPPLIAHVSQESREVAINNSVVRGFPTAEDVQTTTWFIGSRDILELHSGYPYPLSNPEPFFSAAERIAINAGDFEGEIEVVVRDLIEGHRFHSVKMVYLIVDQIETAYWPRFRPDITEQDKGKGSILDLCSDEDQKKIDAYKTWARFQEMSPVFPRRDEVELALRSSLDKVILDEIRGYHERLLHQGRHLEDAARGSFPTNTPISSDHPWILQQWRRLPEFRPALLVLGWR